MTTTSRIYTRAYAGARVMPIFRVTRVNMCKRVNKLCQVKICSQKWGCLHMLSRLSHSCVYRCLHMFCLHVFECGALEVFTRFRQKTKRRILRNYDWCSFLCQPELNIMSNKTRYVNHACDHHFPLHNVTLLYITKYFDN